MKKIFTLTAMAVITCSLLIGCSNKNETSEESLGDIIIYDDYTSSEQNQPEKDSESQNSEISTEIKDTENTNNSEDTKEPENSEENKESEKTESTEESTKPDNGGITSDEPDKKNELIYVSFEYFNYDENEKSNNTYKIYIDDNGKYCISRSLYYVEIECSLNHQFEISKNEYYDIMKKINELNWSACENYKEEIIEEGFEDDDYDNHLIMKMEDGNTIEAMWETLSPMGFDKNWELLYDPINLLVGSYVNKQ